MDWLIVFCAQFLIVFLALLALWTWLKLPNKLAVRVALAMALATSVSFVLSKIAGALYYDPRPFTDGSVTSLFHHAADNGFPSEHTWLAMTTATLIFYYARKWAGWAFTITIVVGAARVLAHVHSPIDIAGGLVIGAVGAWVGWVLSDKIYISKIKSQ